MSDGRNTVWDSEVRGLHTISFPSGKASWYVYYRAKSGKQRRQKLAATSIIGLTEARNRARKLLADVTLGNDPLSPIDRVGTVAGLYDVLSTTHWTPEKPWSKETKRLYRKYIQAAFGALKVSRITAPEVYEWHQALKHSPYEANRAKSVLSTILNFAESMGEREVGSNPCKVISRFPEKKRKRFADDSEIAKIGEILRREQVRRPKQVAFIYLLIFSGARPFSIANATWDDLTIYEINGEKYGVLRVMGKTGEEEIVLPPQAIKALPESGTPGKKILEMSYPRAFWNRIRMEAGCPDLWARDWRRTFGTMGLSNGMPMGTLAELLNHKDHKTTMLYAKLIADARLRASYAIGQQLEQRLG